MSVPGGIPLASLQPHLQQFVEEYVQQCQPTGVHVCDGSEEEYQALIQGLVSKGSLTKLKQFENRYVSSA